MSDVTYKVVEHDGGWAYKVADVYSETFGSHDDALAAAKDAAERQQLAGETSGISYQDADGRWHEEISAGEDRPHTEIDDVAPTRN